MRLSTKIMLHLTRILCLAGCWACGAALAHPANGEPSALDSVVDLLSRDPSRMAKAMEIFVSPQSIRKVKEGICSAQAGFGGLTLTVGGIVGIPGLEGSPGINYTIFFDQSVTPPRLIASPYLIVSATAGPKVVVAAIRELAAKGPGGLKNFLKPKVEPSVQFGVVSAGCEANPDNAVGYFRTLNAGGLSLATGLSNDYVGREANKIAVNLHGVRPYSSVGQSDFVQSTQSLTSALDSLSTLPAETNPYSGTRDLTTTETPSGRSIHIQGGLMRLEKTLRANEQMLRALVEDTRTLFHRYSKMDFEERARSSASIDEQRDSLAMKLDQLMVTLSKEGRLTTFGPAEYLGAQPGSGEGERVLALRKTLTRSPRAEALGKIATQLNAGLTQLQDHLSNAGPLIRSHRDIDSSRKVDTIAPLDAVEDERNHCDFLLVSNQMFSADGAGGLLKQAAKSVAGSASLHALQSSVVATGLTSTVGLAYAYSLEGVLPRLILQPEDLPAPLANLLNTLSNKDGSCSPPIHPGSRDRSVEVDLEVHRIP